MKLTIESTTKVVTLMVDGHPVPARIWEGATETGIPVHCYITRVAVHESLLHDYAIAKRFETELQEQRKPSFEVEHIPLRLIL